VARWTAHSTSEAYSRWSDAAISPSSASRAGRFGFRPRVVISRISPPRADVSGEDAVGDSAHWSTLLMP